MLAGTHICLNWRTGDRRKELAMMTETARPAADSAERAFLASYLQDIGEEISPERFRSYLDDIEKIAPPEVFETLRRAAVALDEARAQVDRAVKQLPPGGADA